MIPPQQIPFFVRHLNGAGLTSVVRSSILVIASNVKVALTQCGCDAADLNQVVVSEKDIYKVTESSLSRPPPRPQKKDSSQVIFIRAWLGILTFFPKSLVPSPPQALIRSPERLVHRDVDAARAEEMKMARVAKEVFILISGGCWIGV